jgi:tripartite-type tricarboxylate transporter receptor subunit TctC
MLKTRRILLILLANLTLIPVPAMAARYPDKPVCIIGRAASPGGDIISRVQADRPFRTSNPRAVVDAQPGAAGEISIHLALQAITVDNDHTTLGTAYRDHTQKIHAVIKNAKVES